VDICYKTHTTPGPGLLESVYEDAFVYELDRRGIAYTRQQGDIKYYVEATLDVRFRTDVIMRETDC
jgi:GxxExxY protein